MKTLVHVLAGILVVGGFACAPAPPEVHTVTLTSAHYQEFRTFAFAPVGGPPAGYKSSALSAKVIERMKPEITAALERKGYVPAATLADADLAIACGAGRREVEVEVPVSARLSAATGEDTEEHDFTESRFVIDIYDKEGGQIWHGDATAKVRSDGPQDARLRATVDRMLAPFPGRARAK
jgi:hypothetical protein